MKTHRSKLNKKCEKLKNFENTGPKIRAIHTEKYTISLNAQSQDFNVVSYPAYVYGREPVLIKRQQFYFLELDKWILKVIWRKLRNDKHAVKKETSAGAPVPTTAQHAAESQEVKRAGDRAMKQNKS